MNSNERKQFNTMMVSLFQLSKNKNFINFDVIRRDCHSIDDILVYLKSILANNRDQLSKSDLEVILDLISQLSTDNYNEIEEAKVIIADDNLSEVEKARKTCEANEIDAEMQERNNENATDDFFSIRVTAENQAIVDNIISRFSNKGVNMKFGVDSNGIMILGIHNVGNLIDTNKMFSEITDAINNSKNNVDYLKEFSDETKNAQLNFMLENPDSLNSYAYDYKNKDKISKKGTMFQEIKNSANNDGIVFSQTDEKTTLIDNESGKEIIQDVDYKYLDKVASLAGSQASSNNITNESYKTIVADSGDELNYLNSEKVDKAKEVSSRSSSTKTISSSDVVSVVNTYRENANQNGLNGIDIIVTPGNDTSTVDITIGKNDREDIKPVTLSCNKDEFSEGKSQLIDSMDGSLNANSLESSVNYQLESSDGSTLTVVDTNLEDVNSVNKAKAKVNSKEYVYVYTNNSNNSEGAFSTEGILILILIIIIFILLGLFLFIQ